MATAVTTTLRHRRTSFHSPLASESFAGVPVGAGQPRYIGAPRASSAPLAHGPMELVRLPPTARRPHCEHPRSGLHCRVLALADRTSQGGSPRNRTECARRSPLISGTANQPDTNVARVARGALAPRPPRRHALGLSTTHNRPRKSDLWQANVYAGGSLIEVHSPPTRGQRGGGKRGIVRRFSEASRRRLMRALSRTLRTQLPTFITLTYPDGFPGDPRQWKADLKAWLKRVRRQFPNAAGFWKLELMQRKSGTRQGEVAPHFHLLMWGLPESWEQADGMVWFWRHYAQQQRMSAPGLVFWKLEKWCDGEWQFTMETGSGRDNPGAAVEFISERPNKKGQVVRTVETWKRDSTQSFENLVYGVTDDGHKRGAGCRCAASASSAPAARLAPTAGWARDVSHAFGRLLKTDIDEVVLILYE